MPVYSEMLKLFEFRSKNAVHNLLRRLEAAGYVTIESGHTAATPKLIGGLKLLGAVQAGFPSPAEEQLLDTLNLDEYLISNPEATFVLRVTGDSMIDAGIQPGDLALIEKGATPKQNDIVIAQIDGEWTMKFFVRTPNGIELEPANKNYQTLTPRHSLEIGGVVRSVIRRYD
jgi:repressor LexA